MGIKIVEKKSQYVKIEMLDKNGNTIQRWVHGYILGLLIGAKQRVENNWHAFIIIDGAVGDGKSNMASLLTALWEQMNDSNITFDNVCWTTESFIKKTDRTDNFKKAIWWDEAIQGSTGRDMAMTKIGSQLTKALVTKRVKKHLYILLIDNIRRYSKDIVEFANAWIHIKSFGLERGYFDVYTKKNKMTFIYNAFKHYNRNWDSYDVKNVTKDCKGKFDDFSNVFLDEQEYDKRKLEETKQIEDKKSGVNWTKQKAQAFGLWCKGMKHKDICEELGCTIYQIQNWVNRDYKSLVIQLQS